MSRKRSHEEASTIMLAANFTPLEEYPGAGKPWKCRCETCKNEVSPRLSTVQMGAGCVHCAGLAKITLDEAIAIFEAADLLPIGEYKNSKTPWKAQCKKCKRVVTPSVYYVKSNGNGCKYCSNRIAGIKRRKPEHEAAALFSSKGLKPLVPYPGINKPWHSIHERCGRETYPRLSDIKAGEGGCKYCAGKVVDEESAIKTMQDAGFYPLEPYKSNKSYWRCIHLSCGNEVRTKFNTVQQGKGGCSFCSPTAKIPENEAVKFFELNGLRPLEPYVSSAKPWLSIHLACGNKVSPSWNSIRSNRLVISRRALRDSKFRVLLMLSGYQALSFLNGSFCSVNTFA